MLSFVWQWCFLFVWLLYQLIISHLITTGGFSAWSIQGIYTNNIWKTSVQQRCFVVFIQYCWELQNLESVNLICHRWYLIKVVRTCAKLQVLLQRVWLFMEISYFVFPFSLICKHFYNVVYNYFTLSLWGTEQTCFYHS